MNKWQSAQVNANRNIMDKRKGLAFLFMLVIIALFVILALSHYSNQPKSTPTNTPTVDSAKIVATSSGGWGNPVGMTLDFIFNVTIRDVGVNEIDGLTLNLTVPGVSNEIYESGSCAPIGMLQPGETSEVQAYIEINNGYENMSQFVGHNATITLMLGDRTLDESSILLPQM